MKIHAKFDALFLALAFTLVLAMCTAGCKTKKEKEAEAKQQEKQEQLKATAAQEAATLSLQTQKDAQALNAAKKDFDERLRLYTAVSGEYEGFYLNSAQQKNVIRMTLTTANVMPGFKINRPVRDGEIVNSIEQLNLNVDIEESAQGVRGKVASCYLQGVKPDFFAGTLRLICPAQIGSPARTYTIGFDFSDDKFLALNAKTAIETRSKGVAEDLLQNKIQTIDAMSAVISSPELTFNGKLWRKLNTN